MISVERIKIVKSSANEKERQLAIGSGNFYGLIGFNSKASAQYILVYDVAAPPADGTAPDFMIIAQATSVFALGFGELSYPFVNGLYICNSSTQATKTVGSDDCWFNAQLVKRSN